MNEATSVLEYLIGGILVLIILVVLSNYASKREEFCSNKFTKTTEYKQCMGRG